MGLFGPDYFPLLNFLENPMECGKNLWGIICVFYFTGIICVFYFANIIQLKQLMLRRYELSLTLKALN
jgi:hypothetical protein